LFKTNRHAFCFTNSGFLVLCRPHHEGGPERLEL
jgi:hypothetical protein